MSAPGSNAVSRTGNRHLRGLQGCVIRGSKTAVWREAHNGGIAQVALDQAAQVIHFGL
jgi:hypothetical protein